jgi:hypothetical protein
LSGSVVSLGHNLIGNRVNSIGWIGSDLTGNTASPLDPLLGPLQDNGGPTFTHKPDAVSAAIDAGDDSVLGPPDNLTLDQRGQPRWSGSHTDIGAVEVEQCSSTAAVVTNLNNSGDGSLRQVVHCVPADSTITFAPGVTGTISLTSGQIVIDKDLTIQGPGASVLTVSGNHLSRAFLITSGSVLISGLSLVDGIQPNGGLFTTPRR